MSILRTSSAARRSMRAYLIARDGLACRRCGDLIEGEVPSIGHIRALALGGSDAPDNLGLEHLACNMRAGIGDAHARIVAAPAVNGAAAQIVGPRLHASRNRR